MRRVHRTFVERIRFLAAYECVACGGPQFAARQFQYHLGSEPRCPKCGNSRVTKLKERDHIDPMNTGMLNLVERICGGNLYHCFICRIQFYDRRPLGQGLNRPGISRPSALPVNRRSVPLTIQPDTARSDA
jgi:DNA-directed RNA polymerase subunit RPC12/RpoP